MASSVEDEDDMLLGSQSQQDDMQLGSQSQQLSQMDTGQCQGDLAENKETGEVTWPKTLKGFGYTFNKKGQMHKIGSEEAFEFKARDDDDDYNQRRYEAIGEVITEHIYGLLESETHLERVHIPLDAEEGESKSFIFHSADALTKNDKLLVLIHGSGVVRAGQWARRLIMNDCLDSGTQIPYIKRAQAEGFGVLVMNTNEVKGTLKNGKTAYIRGSGSPEEHAAYVWDHFIEKSPAQNIFIVAHSYGGVVTVDLAIKRDSFLKRVKAIAFTDSVHNMYHQDAPEKVRHHIKKVAKNWVSSSEALDTRVSIGKHDCLRVSAGTPRHEMTSWKSIDSVFKFLNAS